MSRIRSTTALLVGCVWALGLGGTAALAADMAMPVKAPPPPPPPPSWWSGFVELDGESFLINPQGQALINTGSASLVAGLNLTLYKDKTGFINNVTVGGLLATDWSGSGFGGYWANGGNNSTNGVLFDTVFILSQAVTFGQYWTLSNEYVNVYSNDVADGNGGLAKCSMTNCSGFPTLIFDQVKLSLNDSFTGWPITFNPYVTWYYVLPSVGTPGGGGPGSVSPACFSCQVNNYDFFLGATPTWDWTKQFGIPITWKVPTYVTVGPASFWNGNGDGLGLASSGNVGVFTIGLTAVYPLTWLPAQYGHWYAKAGFQWYDVINTSLQVSNAVSICGNTNVTACGSSNTSSIFVGFGGVGVAF